MSNEEKENHGLKNIQDANGMMNVLKLIGLRIMELHFTLNDYDLIEKLNTTSFPKITEDLQKILDQLDMLKNNDKSMKPVLVAAKLIEKVK